MSLQNQINQAICDYLSVAEDAITDYMFENILEDSEVDWYEARNLVSETCEKIIEMIGKQ